MLLAAQKKREYYGGTLSFFFHSLFNRKNQFLTQPKSRAGGIYGGIHIAYYALCASVVPRHRRIVGIVGAIHTSDTAHSHYRRRTPLRPHALRRAG